MTNVDTARALCDELKTKLETAHDTEAMEYVCSRLRMALHWVAFDQLAPQV